MAGPNFQAHGGPIAPFRVIPLAMRRPFVPTFVAGLSPKGTGFAMARAMTLPTKTSDLRVALFSGNYNMVTDGANKALNRLVGYLLAQGAQVRVYSPTVAAPAFEPAGDLVSLPSFAIPGRTEYRVATGLPKSVRRDLEAFAPNVVHVSSPDPSAHHQLHPRPPGGHPAAARRPLPPPPAVPLLPGLDPPRLRVPPSPRTRHQARRPGDASGRGSAPATDPTPGASSRRRAWSVVRPRPGRRPHQGRAARRAARKRRSAGLVARARAAS